MSKIQRAILSVTDKTGVVEFARKLSGLGVELVSTGGMATAPKTCVESKRCLLRLDKRPSFCRARKTARMATSVFPCSIKRCRK